MDECPYRVESRDGSVVCDLQELHRLMTAGAAVGVQREEWKGKNTALKGSCSDGPGVRDMFPQFHMLPPVRQEVCDPPVGGISHIQLGELVV